MAFEQEHTDELEQLQKQKENERIQQELDLAIARIENEQIQRALDDAIERLDQQISHQDENTEEQDTDDQVSQQSSSTEEDLAIKDPIIEEQLEDESMKHNHTLTIEHLDQASQTLTSEEEVFSHDLVRDENIERLNSLKQSGYSFDDQLINNQEEKTHVLEENETGSITNHMTIPRSDFKEEIIPVEYHLNENQDKQIPISERELENTNINCNDQKSKDLLNQNNLEKSLFHHTQEKISKQDTSQNTYIQKLLEKTNQRQIKTIEETQVHSHFKIECNKKDRVKDEATVNQEIKILNPKTVEKEWNKHVREGKPVPEEFQKKVFQQYDSGFLKHAGLIKKEGKWFLETSWENYHLVKSFIQKPHIQKSLAFQLWAEFKTEKPLHFVRGQLNKNALYYSIKLEKSLNLPHELIGKNVYVRNTKNFFNHGHSFGHYLQTTLKSFETSFLKRITNWGIPTVEYKVIRDEIFRQFSEKYGDLFARIMVLQKRPLVFMQPYNLDSLEKSFIKCFVEYFSEGSRLWKFRSRNGCKAYDSYYRYFNFQSLSVLTRLIDNKIKVSINQDSPFIQQGNKCMKSNDPKDYQDFAKKWNQHVNNGGKITQDMWVTYNKIQTLKNYPLRRFKQFSMEQYRVQYYFDLAHKFENLLERRGRFPTSLYEHWFVHRGLTKGELPFIKINIHNPFTKVKERYFLPNANYGWNFNPAYTKSVIGINSKDRTGPRMIIDLFMEEIPITTQQTRKIRELIVDKLRSNGFVGNEKAGNWFKNVYKLEYNEILIDKVLNQYFWKTYNSNRLWKDNGYLTRSKHIHELINHYKQNDIQFKEFTKDLVELAHVDKFKIALVDKSTILEAILKDLKKEINSYDIDFWDSLKIQMSARKLANIIQKHKVRHLEYLDGYYTIKQARLEYNPDISGDPIKFWNECNSNGITRLSAALMQSSTIRSKIRKITKTNDKLGILNIHKKVSVEDHWGRDNTKRNVVTFPDGVTFRIEGKKKRGRAVEFIQNKIITELSGNSGNLPVRDYFLDFFKTIGKVNGDTGVLKFQVEFVPKGETLGGLISTKLNENFSIISYWGKCTTRVQRIGEITSAFVTGRFRESITSKKQLVKYIVSKLNQGETVLNGTKMEKADKRVIKELVSSLGSLKDLKPTTFYKYWFIEIMKRYSTDFGYISHI